MLAALLKESMKKVEHARFIFWRRGDGRMGMGLMGSGASDSPEGNSVLARVQIDL